MRQLLLLVILLSSFSWSDDKDYLLVITSQRNAETIADAARIFYQRYPEKKNLVIKARSDIQVRKMPVIELNKLIQNSHGLLGVGLYGPSVPVLQRALRERRTIRELKTAIFMNSDHRLVLMSQYKGVRLFTHIKQVADLAKTLPGENFAQTLKEQIQNNPSKESWLLARSYWQAGGSENTAELYAWLFNDALGHSFKVSPRPPFPTPLLRWYASGKTSATFPSIDESRSLVAIIDHSGGGRPADTILLRETCNKMQQDYNIQCISALAYWGDAAVKAVQQLLPVKKQLTAVVMLQDFVIGGGEGNKKVNQILRNLDVPVINAIKQRDRTAVERALSADGLAQEKVYYQVAMPELQGASQPLVIATAGKPNVDELTGIRTQGITPDFSGIRSLLTRINRWSILQKKANREKRVAIIYYNHPPGRHNIGADNLDIPASLWHILQNLKQQGYHTGELPPTQEALLDLIQAQGINLPENATELAKMSTKVNRMKPEVYKEWFRSLPETIRREMEQGPFGLLHEQLITAIEEKKTELASKLIQHKMKEMHHLLEGVDHKGRTRALALLEQLEQCYESVIKEAGGYHSPTSCISLAPQIISALQSTGIEGLGGWGKAPGEIMVYNNEILFPGIQFGNIFIGPQPPRGWQINEELLHANLTFPPPHQYLAFYHFLKDSFKADALVHLGRHSTYEFLPLRSVGLAEDDYPRIIAGDIPGIYPYIVDGVGEGIQAKRRGLAVMVDHLTPPLSSTPLYDQLLQLRQLVEGFEASHSIGNEIVSKRLIAEIREKVSELELEGELASAMAAKLRIMGIKFDEVDDDMLVHEVGHYLTELQEQFMPLGLHVFGKDWQSDAINVTINSMKSTDHDNEHETWRMNLIASPQAELDAFFNALNGGYIKPGIGNDPIRSPDSLPTGKNFFALDSSLIPSKLAWEMGKEMATAARKNNSQTAEKSESLILWASDVVRDEGVMIAFGLDMLGVEPVWNSRGLVKGLKHQALSSRIRRDVVFTSSGLFRDLYGQQMLMLNRASLLALSASGETIKRDHPALSLALHEALEPLGKSAKWGDESLDINQVAAHWVRYTREIISSGISEGEAGITASQRVFGDAPGIYGAGVNRLVERSGAWEQREQLASVYMRRLGYSYGINDFGAPAQDIFKRVLSDVENTYFGRSSNVYGLIDNNDAFDYFGGLSLAVETLTGKAPNNYVIDNADPTNAKTQPLERAMRQELRGRFLNPEWLKAQMKHDFAGARTMGSQFMEYLWGWQVTNPTFVGDWAWEEVKAVYIDDRYNIDLDTFLEKDHNVHVKSNILAIMLVAIHKQFWQADEKTTRQLANEFAELISQHGLPGSGHTTPDHPMLPWLEQNLSEEQWARVELVISSAKRLDPYVQKAQKSEIHRLTEIELLNSDSDGENNADDTNQKEPLSASEKAKQNNEQLKNIYILQGLAVAILLFSLFGFYRGKKQSRRVLKSALED